MTPILLLGAGLVLAGWIVWRVWGRPLMDVRNTIRAIANNDPAPPIVRSRLRFMTETAADLGRIAERLRRQRRQLADEGFSLRAILGSMVEGIVIVDGSQRIRLVNDALLEMFALHRSPVDRTIPEVFRFPELSSAIERAYREVRSIHLEIRDAPRIGETRANRHFRVNLSPLMPGDGHEPAGVLAVIDDISDVRVLESVRREFVANVSHEFRTPLSIINGYVETLLDGALDDRPMAERSLEVILKHGKRLNLLIEDLLTIAQMERANPELQRAPASLGAIARNVVDRLEARITARKAQVEITFPPDADEAEVDAARIEQAFFNLLTNALQYGTAGEPAVQISAKRRGDEIEVSFTDNGPGIPFKDQPHIFERFYRVHKDRSRDAGGTGLGLSIVKNIAMAHGGHVSVRSTPGSGATFRIVLPVRAPER